MSLGLAQQQPNLSSETPCEIQDQPPCGQGWVPGFLAAGLWGVSELVQANWWAELDPRVSSYRSLEAPELVCLPSGVWGQSPKGPWDCWWIGWALTWHIVGLW